jgi:hypothetical protein
MELASINENSDRLLRGIERLIEQTGRQVEAYPEEMFATVSQALSWSHFIELISIEDQTTRLFYQQMSIVEKSYS